MLSAQELQIVGLSLKVAGCAVAVSLPLGLAISWLLSRVPFPGRSLLAGAVHLPLVLPPVVTGYGLLVIFGRQGPIGEILEPLGIVFAFDWTGAVLASAIMGFPLMVRSMKLAFDLGDPRLDQAATTLGARPLATFATVTLPLAMPGVAAGAVLAFAKAFGEFGATITFVSNIPGETQTLPLAIYGLTQVPGGEGEALRLIVIAATVSITALVISEIMVRRATAAIHRHA